MKEHQRGGLWGLLGCSSALSSLAAVIFGLLIGFIIILIADAANAPVGFGALVFGAFGDLKSLGNVLCNATPIIMTGLAVGFAGKTGLFNIGASGQFIVGAYCAIWVGVKCAFLPGPLPCVAAILASMLGGALWGALPGILKAWRNVHEVIACIMMNYIGMYLVNYLIPVTGIHNAFRNETMPVADNANLPKMGLDQIFRDGGRTSSVNSGIFIAILAAVVIYVILDKTRLGYELKACGYNKNAAQYAGISANRGIVTAMVVSGALAGLGGALMYLAGSGKGISVVDVLAPEGFNGIPVALLALNSPIGIIFSGLFIGYLTEGGFNMQAYNYVPQLVDMIVSVIIYFSAFSLLIKGFIQKLIKPETPAEQGGDGA